MRMLGNSLFHAAHEDALPVQEVVLSMERRLGASVVAFSIVILLLVFILLFAQSKLVQSGDVNIIVNGDNDNPIITSAGSTLLSTLSAQYYD